MKKFFLASFRDFIGLIFFLLMRLYFHVSRFYLFILDDLASLYSSEKIFTFLVFLLTLFSNLVFVFVFLFFLILFVRSFSVNFIFTVLSFINFIQFFSFYCITNFSLYVFIFQFFYYSWFFLLSNRSWFSFVGLLRRSLVISGIFIS